MSSNRHSHFYPNACAVCNKFGNEVKRCKKCRMISYCSDEHQANHWPKHEEFCKAMQQACRSHMLVPKRRDEGLDLEGWLNHQNKFMLTLMQKLRRHLTAYEREMCIYQVHCYHRCNTDVGLINCSDCASVSYCMDHIAEENLHKETCGLLRQCFFLDVFNNKHVKLDYLQTIKNRTDFRNMMSFVQDYILSIKTRGNITAILPELMNLHSEYFTHPLTILYGLELIKRKMDSQKEQKKPIKTKRKKTDVMYERKTSPPREVIYSIDHQKEPDEKDQVILEIESLVIHVIAASETEMVTRQTWEVLFHFIKSLKDLTIIMIGPELGRETGNSAIKEKMCNMCQNKNLLFEYHNVFYEDYAYSSLYKKPDLTVAFNADLINRTCGFLQNSEIWYGSLQMIANQNCPFIVTSYSEEDGGKDITQIEYNVRNIIPNIKPDIAKDNPYAGLRPYRQPGSQKFNYTNFKLILYLAFVREETREE